jgi:hypothetical protein
MYRAFLIDTADQVFAVRMLNSKDDTSAVRLAAKIRTPCQLVEVWFGTRKIGDVEPRNKMVKKLSSFALASKRSASHENSTASSANN